MFVLGLIIGTLSAVSVGLVLSRRGRVAAPPRCPVEVDELPIGVMVLDTDGVVRRANATVRTTMGLDETVPLATVTDLAALDLIDIDGAPVPPDARPIARALHGDTGSDNVLGRELADGRRRWFLVNTTRLLARDGSGWHIVATFADVSSRIERLNRTIAEAGQLRHQALYDGLTGLPNRTLLMDRLSKAEARAARRGSASALLVIDMDGFKAVNDTLGHAAGDEVLVQVAIRLRSVVRNEDTASRLGGDEFVVLCENLHAHSADVEATMIATRVRTVLNQPYTTTAGPAATAASVGVSIAHPGSSIDLDLLHAADAAMLVDKRRQTNTRHDTPVTQTHPVSDVQADQPAGVDAVGHDTGERTNHRIRRVFVVDDDAAMRLLAARIIDVEPTMTVVGEASDGDDAIAQILQLRPDIVLCDVMMPGTSGPAVVQAVRALNPQQLFAFWSATTVNQLEHHLRSLGVPYVEKDRLEELPRRLSDLIAQTRAGGRQDRLKNATADADTKTSPFPLPPP